MTKENNLNNNIAIIEKALQDFKNVKNFTKEKYNIINNLLKIAFDLYEKDNNKGGFLRLLFDYDKEKGWHKPSVIKNYITSYFDFCNIDYVFNVKKQKLFIDYDKKEVISFLDYLTKSKAITKENNEELKTNLLNIKLPFTLNKLTSEQLNACIMQCKKAIKDLKEKENKKQ